LKDWNSDYIESIPQQVPEPRVQIDINYSDQLSPVIETTEVSEPSFVESAIFQDNNTPFTSALEIFKPGEMDNSYLKV